MLRTGCYVKRMESIQFFKHSSVIYTRVQVNSGTIANSCWLIQTYKYQCCRFQVHFISIFSVWFEAPKSHFHWFCIWNISIIHSAKFEAYTCNICDVVTIPINDCSSLFNRLTCCQTVFSECKLIAFSTELSLYANNHLTPHWKSYRAISDLRWLKSLFGWLVAGFLIRRCS